MDGTGIQFRWGTRFSAPVQTGPEAHPASCTMGTGSFPGVKCGRGVTLTSHPFLVPWSRKNRAIPLLSLWAVRPVQSLSACTRVNFFYYRLGQDELNESRMVDRMANWGILCQNVFNPDKAIWFKSRLSLLFASWNYQGKNIVQVKVLWVWNNHPLETAKYNWAIWHKVFKTWSSFERTLRKTTGK